MARTVSASSGWFFGENGSIDGGMIQTLPAGSHGGNVVPAREHVGLRGGQVRPQELPPGPGHLVFPVHPDMAAPHHPGARVCQRRGQPGGLRVMQQHHIAGPDPGRQLDRVRGQHLCVMSGLRRTERGSGQAAVDLVVQPLGDREELGVAGDHQPADRDVQVLHVPDQDLQHLGDPTTRGSRGTATGQGAVSEPGRAAGGGVTIVTTREGLGGTWRTPRA